MYTALQRPIGTNTVYFAGAGFVPGVRSVFTDVQGEPDLLTELTSLIHRFHVWNESHPQAICQRITQGCGEMIGFTIIYRTYAIMFDIDSAKH